VVSRIQGTDSGAPETLHEDQFRLLFDAAAEAIVIGTVDRTVVAINPACERLLGVSAEEVVGRDAFDYVAPEWRSVTYRDLEVQLSRPGDHVRVNTVLVDSAGTRIPVDISSALLVSDDGLVGAQAIVRDLRPSHHAEAALRESEARFRTAFDAAPIGMSLTSLTEGRWLQVNGALCELTGYSAEELLETTFAEITHPDDAEADLALTQRLIAGELSSYELEKRYVRKDGTTVWILLHASIVRGEDDHALYKVAHAQDITARKRRELAAAAFEARHPEAGSLSPREREVLGCLAAGMTSAHAASALGISAETVETHVRRALAKLGARTRTQAVATALQLGLIEGELGSQ
jgi:PAS domain S-box-containing protein